MANFEPQQFGKYYLLEKLAVGGMAEIYKAKTFGVDGFEKQLALKKILPHCSADKEFITMLTDEAKLSVLLSHANIVQVYDLGKVGDDYFISMEYIHGVNLRDIAYRCRERKIEAPTELAVYIISEICKGLDYAHRKTSQNNKPLNIVHRDISPQNVLISYEGEVKIVDFGIAKAAMNISHTMAGILKGKIAYMSPEQALGKPVDHRTDIFSAGIVLYELLTQKKLFKGESQFEVLKKIRTTKIDESFFPNDIAKPLKKILAKALSYYPKDRYQSAGDMQIDLTKYLYQSYVDFSPQKLATFVRDLFSDELKEQQEEAAREAALAAQTSSINVAEEALQENIVHREDTGITMKSTTLKPMHEAKGAESLSGVQNIRRKRKIQRIGTIAVILIILAAAGFAYLKWLHPVWFGAPSVNTGTVRINTTPEGAKIFIDGKDTGLLTPAIVDDLKLNKPYNLKLKKEGFANLSHTVMATSTDPMSLHLTLSKEMGTLKIASKPEGADIFIGGEDTKKETPATITNLELDKEIKIILRKDGYKEFEKVVNLENMEPVEVSAELKKITYGKIRVNTTPGGALVYLNGKSTKKTTPAVLEKLEQGKKYTVRVVKNNYTGFTKTITLDKDEVTISGRLEEKKPEETTTLRVSSSPSGARIYLGGRYTGKHTPATLSGLKVKKTYRVKLTKDNYQAWSDRVYIASAKPQSVSATLRAAAKPPIEKPETPTPPTTPPPTTGGYGTLKVNSNPGGADVFINAEHKGTTPLSVRVPSGRVKVLVNKDGYMRYSTTVNVSPGQTKSLGTVSLGGLYGEVTVSSTPPAANVVFDGQSIAKTPVTIRKVRRDRNHTVSVSLPGYRTWSRSFSMSGTTHKRFNIILEKQ